MDKYLVFTTSAEILRIPSDAVVFVMADGNYSSITTTDGENFVLTMQLGQIENSKLQFAHKCSITNSRCSMLPRLISVD